MGLRRLGQRRLPPLRRSTPPCSGSTWRAGPESQGPDTANRDTLSGELGTLHEHLTEHLDLEERAILPLAASVLTDAEWHAIGDAAVAAMPKSASRSPSGCSPTRATQQYCETCSTQPRAGLS